ncbi:MAG: amidohydrolase [Saezia sp.]
MIDTELNDGRRNLLKGTLGVVAAAGVLGASRQASAAPNQAECGTTMVAPTESKFWLTNITLETGFKYNSQKQVEETLTKKAHLLINNGKIEQVADALPAKDGVAQYDMKGLLVVPSFADMHVHLDKGRYADAWKATTPFTSVRGRIKEEQEILPGLIADTPRKAKALIDLITSFGTSFVRVQCNVDPTVKLQNVEKVLEALNASKDKVDFEMVAFPQHGLLTDGVPELMALALQNGCDLVGGVDPATIDGDIERSLNTTMELAVKYNKDIDLHLHNRAQLGTFTIERLVRLTEQAKWHGRVTIGHAFCLGNVQGGALDDILAKMGSVKMSVGSAISVGGVMPPTDALAKHGVNMVLGTDCINDLWSAYGTGSILERASLMGEWQNWDDEYNLTRALKYITRGITPLDDEGKMVWPKPGDVANISLTTASCSAELIARRSPVKAVFKQGKPSVWKM